jgi:mannosyltransferase
MLWGTTPIGAVGAPPTTRAPAATAPRVTVPVRAMVVAETLLAAALGLFRLGHNSIWADEAYTWSTSARSWSSFVHVVIHFEGGGLLHSLLTFFWLKAGDSPTWLRLPSVVFAALTVPMVYRAARRLFDERVALLAGFLVAINGTLLFYAQEARTYALTVFLVAGSFAFFVDQIKAPTRAGFVGWVAFSALAVYALPLAGGVVVAEAVSLLFLQRSDLRPERLVRGFAAIVVLSTPMVLIQVAQAREGRLNQFLEGDRKPTFVLRAFLALSGGGGPPLILAYGLFAAVTLLTGWTIWRRRGRSVELWATWVPLCVLVVPCFLVVVSSYITPNFASRYFLIGVPGLSIAAAFGLVRLTAYSRRVLVVGVIVTTALASVGVYRYYFRYHSDDFRDAVAYVLEHHRPGDAVAFIGDEARLPFEYYTRNRKTERADLVSALPQRPWGDFGTGDQRLEVPSHTQTAFLARRYPRLWVFRRYDGAAGKSDASFATLARDHSVQKWQFEDTVRLYLYEQTATGR